MKTAEKLRTIRVTLSNNPNSEKSTIFNALTGGNAYVENWPSASVKNKEGFKYKNLLYIPCIDSIDVIYREKTVESGQSLLYYTLLFLVRLFRF